MRHCAPEVKRVTARTVKQQSGQKEIVFDEISGPVRCEFASEGLQALLFLLLVLHSPAPPPIMALEEIEHGVHPRRIYDFVRFLRALTAREDGPQVLLTSHSPLVLDAFRDEPDSVIIFDRHPGLCGPFWGWNVDTVYCCP